MNNHKQLILIFFVWLCVYPIVTGLFYLIRTFGAALPMPVQTLIATAVLVPVMIGWIAPFIRTHVMSKIYS